MTRPKPGSTSPVRLWLGWCGCFWFTWRRDRGWAVMPLRLIEWGWKEFTAPNGTHYRAGAIKVKRPDKPEASEVISFLAPAGNDLKTRPLLKAFMTSPVYEGTADPREPGTITIRAYGGAWSISMRDTTSGLYIRLSVPSLDALWVQLESVLNQPKVPWEIDPWGILGSKKSKSKRS